MKEIPLTRGYVAIVDDEDFHLVSNHKWRTVLGGKTAYAGRTCHIGKKTITEFMHRVIVGLDVGHTPQVDHKDGNGLNNTRENLRIATCSQNMANCNKRKHSAQPYKGVFLSKEGNRWRARITTSQKKIFLGTFETAEEAALAYDKKAREIFGEFAKTNF